MTETTWSLYRAGKPDQAVMAADAALNSIDAGRHLHFSGLALMAMGDAQRGVTRLWAAGELYPETEGYHRNAAIVSLQAGQFDWAHRFATSWLQRFPATVEAELIRTRALIGLGRLGDAEECCRGAHELEPRNVEVLNQLANVLVLRGQEEAAVGVYRQALEISPGDECAITNLCLSLRTLRHDAEADAMLPDLRQCKHPMSRFGLATTLLSQGQWGQGFEIYRERWQAENMAHELPRMHGLPWMRQLSDAWGQDLLVVCEQGFGDSIQFCRLVPGLLAYANTVTIEAPPELKHLLTSLDPRVAVIEHGESRDRFTMLVPMLDLPAIRRVSTSLAFDSDAYLGVGREIRNVLNLPYTPMRRIGLVWEGRHVANPEQAAINRRRSIRFEQLTPLLDVPNVQFVALQPTGPQHEGQFWNECPKIWAPVSPGMTFACTAAMIDQLDLVISVDTAVAHLAAAMGKPTWMLSRRDACWRWIRDRESTPWYRSMRIFNQTQIGEWGPQLQQIAVALRSELGRRPGSDL